MFWANTVLLICPTRHRSQKSIRYKPFDSKPSVSRLRGCTHSVAGHGCTMNHDTQIRWLSPRSLLLTKYNHHKTTKAISSLTTSTHHNAPIIYLRDQRSSSHLGRMPSFIPQISRLASIGRPPRRRSHSTTHAIAVHQCKSQRHLLLVFSNANEGTCH